MLPVVLLGRLMMVLTMTATTPTRMAELRKDLQHTMKYKLPVKGMPVVLLDG